MMNTAGTVPGNLPKVSKTYCAWSATHALNSASWTWALPRTPGLSVQAPGVSRLNGPPGTELALREGLDRRGHVRVVRGAVGLEHPLAPGGVGGRPALVLVVAETEAGHLGVAGGAEHREAVDPVEHPAAEAHRLEHQHAGVAGGGELRGGLGERVLLGEREREGLLDVDQPAELLQPRDLAVVDVVVDRVAVLDEEAEDRDQVLGDVGDRDDEQRAGDVHAPGVVPLQVGLLRAAGRAARRRAFAPARVALDHQLGRDLLDGRVDERAGVAGREEVHARVVGEEQLGGVKAGRGRERAPGRPRRRSSRRAGA